MPELVEQMYCSQQIVIPPKFPYILKRYCKAAIKTQPYDLLRWSFEYFKALAQGRPPPVKLRLEYPVFSTEGGLTRGCLKVLANQLSSMNEIPLSMVKAAWGGFCLDQMELKRILCLCEVYRREETVPFLHFIAVAGGLLTKSLTHTMILLCESLTKEPDGGSAAISVKDFLTMYRFLARIDASKDIKYLDGYREGEAPPEPFVIEEEESAEVTEEQDDASSDDFWNESTQLQKVTIINSHVPKTTELSSKFLSPVGQKIERSPSVERAAQIERDSYMMERKGRPLASDDIDKKLREISNTKMSTLDVPNATQDQPTKTKEPETAVKTQRIQINVYDENELEIPYKFYGERLDEDIVDEEDVQHDSPEEQEEKLVEEEMFTKIARYVAECYAARQTRIEDLEQTFDDIAAIVDRFHSASYDLGMVAGRQMSTTSGEFIAHHIEREIMDYINEQIGILPDPDLKKKKIKPEELEMIKQLLKTYLDENMDIIVPEVEEVEEEEQPIPDIVVVYAVPGIGPPVDEDIMKEFQDYALEVCAVQADLFMPRNIRHFMCPPMEKYEEYKYDKEVQDLTKTPVEEVATGGAITDT